MNHTTSDLWTADPTDAPKAPNSTDALAMRVSVSRSTDWQVLDTTLGQQRCLVGPSPRNPKKKAMALFPPGAKVIAPEGSDPRVSSDGWRITLWGSDQQGNLYIDVGTPTHLRPVSLSHVIGLVEAECPSELTWVADRLVVLLVNACTALRANRRGRRISLADKWQRDAESMLDELDFALAPVFSESLTPGGDTAGSSDLWDGLPEDLAEAWLPRDPGKWDPRFREGKMREIYGDLRARATSVRAI